MKGERTGVERSGVGAGLAFRVQQGDGREEREGDAVRVEHAVLQGVGGEEVLQSLHVKSDIPLSVQL